MASGRVRRGLDDAPIGKTRPTRQVATSSQTSTTSSRVIIWWSSVSRLHERRNLLQHLLRHGYGSDLRLMLSD